MSLAANSESQVVFMGRGNSRAVVNAEVSKELIFAVVGPVGSGTTWVAQALGKLAGETFDTKNIVPIKASRVIEDGYAESLGDQPNKLDRATKLQDAGDILRQSDEGAVGALLIAKIKEERAKLLAQKQSTEDVTYLPDSTQKPRIYIIDSLKHPAEVELLRSVYREAFCLIGVVCESDIRQRRLQDGKCSGSSLNQIKEFMRRDESAKDKWGQQVSKTFHLSDFFIDNTPERMIDGKENKDWDVTEKLGRLLDILQGKKIVRPFASETGMFHAAGAQLRSACLSRQVGASLTDAKGNLIATGTNEAPKAGGGVYGGDFASEAGIPSEDHRCAITNKYCSNTKEQDKIIKEVIGSIPELRGIADTERIVRDLKETAVGRLLEFSRAVHAEMDALMSAARAGISTVNTKLFVTTFPCHYCARHIVTAGVSEVQFIEPYPKSKAYDLHGDAIEHVFMKWFRKPEDEPFKVLFRPFTGVAPRMYVKAFLKNRDLKNSSGVLSIGEPKWTPGLLQKSYLQLEDALESDQNGK